jgi:hypothetical protein
VRSQTIGFYIKTLNNPIAKKPGSATLALSRLILWYLSQKKNPVKKNQVWEPIHQKTRQMRTQGDTTKEKTEANNEQKLG